MLLLSLALAPVGCGPEYEVLSTPEDDKAYGSGGTGQGTGGSTGGSAEGGKTSTGGVSTGGITSTGGTGMRPVPFHRTGGDAGSRLIHG